MPAFLPRVEKSRKDTEQKESAERNDEGAVQTEGTLSAVQTEAIKKCLEWKIRVLSPRLSAVPVRKEAGRKAQTRMMISMDGIDEKKRRNPLALKRLA